jgi:hypothetical protein
MGSNTGSSSGGGSASKAGMSKKSAATNPVVQGIRADQYAKKKLGITKTVAGPVKGASTSVTGYYSTKVPNQMYGSEYQAARNEYLASQGLGTIQKNGSFTTGVQTDKGLTFTTQARQAYEASKREPIPLSRQMYESQRRVGATAFGILGAMMGMPTLGLTMAANMYKSSYANYINTNRQSTYFTPTSGGGRDSGGQTTTTTATGDTASAVQEDASKKNAALTAARVKEMAAASKRQFYKISGKSITGKMSSK